MCRFLQQQSTQVQLWNRENYNLLTLYARKRWKGADIIMFRVEYNVATFDMSKHTKNYLICEPLFRTGRYTQVFTKGKKNVAVSQLFNFPLLPFLSEHYLCSFFPIFLSGCLSENKGCNNLKPCIISLYFTKAKWHAWKIVSQSCKWSHRSSRKNPPSTKSISFFPFFFSSKKNNMQVLMMMINTQKLQTRLCCNVKTKYIHHLLAPLFSNFCRLQLDRTKWLLQRFSVEQIIPK